MPTTAKVYYPLHLLTTIVLGIINNTIVVNGINLDRFNYESTETIVLDDNETIVYSYGPKDWHLINCTDTSSTCEGYPDEWPLAKNWSIHDNGNTCRDCSTETGIDCVDKQHRQGPTYTKRSIGDPLSDDYEECIDLHWMKYYDGTCTWKDYTQNMESDHYNSFFIRRNSLQLHQPLKTNKKTGEMKLTCPNKRTKNRDPIFPKLDYSKGFPDWWHLSHMEIKTPSEWKQDGKSYDGEITYTHFYSIPYDSAPPYSKIGSVVIFFEAYDNVEPDPYMDKIICQFRKTEDQVRKDCNLPPIDYDKYYYPGCWNIYRDSADSTTEGRTRHHQRNLRATTTINNGTTHTMIGNTFEPSPPLSNSHRIILNEDDMKPIDDFDFDSFIDEQVQLGTHNHVESSYATAAATAAQADAKDTAHQYKKDHRRHLIDYEHVPYHPYQFLVNVRTEYYFRVAATQTVPPCQEPTHYRIMKDPLRIHSRQLREIERLIAHRIAPAGSSYKECQYDTAGKPRDGYESTMSSSSNTGKKQTPSTPSKLYDAVDVNRPIQTWHKRHVMRFCECKDWKSRWPDDREWCNMNINERFYSHPYNWDETKLRRTRHKEKSNNE